MTYVRAGLTKNYPITAARSSEEFFSTLITVGGSGRVPCGIPAFPPDAGSLLIALRTTVTRISVFVDAANLFYLQQRLGWHVNPQRLLDHIVGFDQLADAFWYTGVRVQAGGEHDQEKFLKWLTHAGYTVRRKPIKSFVNVERGATIEKANLDVEIVMDMLTTADTYDVAALVSGDGDFERTVEYLRSRGKRVRVYSIDPVIAFELRNAVGTHYVDFWTIRSEVERVEDAPAIPPAGPAPIVPAANINSAPPPAAQTAPASNQITGGLPVQSVTTTPAGEPPVDQESAVTPVAAPGF